MQGLTSLSKQSQRSPIWGLLAWCWLFAPLLWMWPGQRSVLEACASALLLVFCLLWRTSTRIAVVLLVLAGCCSLGYFLAVSSEPDEFFWYSVLGSNPTEAVEYAASYRVPDALRGLSWLLPALLAGAYLWRSAPVLRQRWLRVVGWATVCIWLAWTGISLFKGYTLNKAISRVERVYPLKLAQSYFDYHHNARASYMHTVPPVAKPVQSPMVDVLVMVLGESSSAHRWSLLGYQGNDTNAPLRGWADQLAALPVTANGNNTGKTLSVLVTGQRMDPIPTEGAAMYLDWAAAAGFERVSITNQMAAGFVNLALRERSNSFQFMQNGSLDGAMTQPLARSLAERTKPLLVTLHMYGSHPKVSRRYPPEGAQWSDPYDNSIHYSSALLAEWIAQLQAMPDVRAALVYASDHGQDFPVCGGSYSHGITRSSYEVPLMVWANDALRQSQPQWWQQVKHLEQTAVDSQGVPRYNSFLMTQWLQQLLGHSFVQANAQVEAGAARSPYPPAETAANCVDWTPQVLKLHPAAVE